MRLDLGAPQPKQLLFLRDAHSIVGYGGARGGGKSWAVRCKAVIMAFRYPGIKQMILRKTYPELTENHIQPLKELLHTGDENPQHRLARYNDSKKVMTFPNGSRILFRYCDTEKDVDRFQGLETDILYVDEATHHPEETLKKLAACVRGVNAYPKRIYYTCNPGGVGHAYIKRLFIDKKYLPDENPEDYSFIQAKLDDNRVLTESDPAYEMKLRAMPPKIRKAWLEGEWDIFEGQFFEEFRDDPAHYADRRFTHVIAPFQIPAAWTVLRSFDWGYNKPFSLAWYAVDYDGVVYRILELYGCTETPNEGVKWTDDKIFAEAARIEREHPYLRGHAIAGVADPAIWDASHGISTAETAARHGIQFTPGDHARIPGWMQCHYRLAFDAEGCPQFYVFSNCKAFIRTIPMLCYDAHRVEDIDSEMEDHVADEWRYLLMSRPIKPVMPAEHKPILSDPLNQLPVQRRAGGIRIF